MSKVKTRKEISEELEASQAEVSALIETHQLEIEKLNIELLESKSGLEATHAKIESLQAELEIAVAGAENAIVERDEATEKATEAEKIVVEKEAKIELQEKVLADPTIVDAAIVVPSDIDQKAEDAEADLEEDGSAEDQEPKSLLERYRLMPQGTERSAFYRGNKKDLLKQLEDENQEA